MQEHKYTAVTLDAQGAIADYVGQAGQVNIPRNPSADYLAMGHIHDAVGTDGTGTYSVFSLGDLAWIAQVELNGGLRTKRFVAFLSTARGTHYAITINSPSKFRAFFEYLKANRSTITPSERQTFYAIAEKRQPLFDKYYNQADPHPGWPLIKDVTNTNTEVDLKFFLNFIAEGNIGLSVFETDGNFNNFSKIQPDPSGNLERVPCN